MFDSRLMSSLSDKENLCQNLLNRADEAFRNNGKVANRDQCLFLQRAADLESEMAQLTTGSERDHHIKRKNDIDYEIMRLRSELDKINSKKTESNKNVNSGGNVSEKNKAEQPKTAKTKDEEELDRTVNTWYKDAPKHSFDDVSGMSELKKKLNSCITDARAGNLMEYLKIPKLNSYFFVGPPGCGKTYIIEAFAHELMEQDYKFISLQGSDIISRYVGAAEKSVTRLFEEAEKSPCIVFIDEIDSVCKNRSLPNLPEYAANITTSFLTGYNRIHSSDSKVIFIAATNYPNRVDNAMLDRVEIVRVPLPDTKAREFAFEKHFNNIVELHNLTYRDMAVMTKRCNYRDIDRLATMIKRTLFREVLEICKDENTAIDMLKNGKYKLTKEKFTQIFDKFVPSPKESVLNDLKKWEKSVQSITESNDVEIESIYEPSDSEYIENEKSVSYDAVETVKFEEPGKALVPLKDELEINAETGCIYVEFAVYPKNRPEIRVAINSQNCEVNKTENGYSVEYKPTENETYADVLVADKNEYVGDFTVKIIHSEK